MASPATIAAPPKNNARSMLQRLRGGDPVAHAISALVAATVLLITVYVIYELWAQSADARHKFGLSFLISSQWDPNAGQFGALPFIYGTLVTSIVALLVSIPLGVGAAIFLSEMA